MSLGIYPYSISYILCTDKNTTIFFKGICSITEPSYGILQVSNLNIAIYSNSFALKVILKGDSMARDNQTTLIFV